MAGDKMSAPFTVQVPSATDPGDTAPPALNVSPANTQAVNTASAITLSSEPTADIYYTIDGTPAVEGGLPTDTAKLYTGPIALSAQVTLHAVAFDRAGNFETFTGVYKPPADTAPAPVAVSAITGTAGQAAVTISWAAPEAGVTGYGVQLYVVERGGHQGHLGAAPRDDGEDADDQQPQPGHRLLLHRRRRRTPPATVRSPRCRAR